MEESATAPASKMTSRRKNDKSVLGQRARRITWRQKENADEATRTKGSPNQRARHAQDRRNAPKACPPQVLQELNKKRPRQRIVYGFSFRNKLWKLRQRQVRPTKSDTTGESLQFCNPLRTRGTKPSTSADKESTMTRAQKNRLAEKREPAPGPKSEDQQAKEGIPARRNE